MTDNMTRKGTMVYWEISDMNTSKDALKALGMEDYLPRNDAKASLIKALHIVTKGNKKFYKRYGDEGKFVNFTVVNPEVIVEQGIIDVNFTKEITVRLEKSSGLLEITQGQDGSFFEKIKGLYQQERQTINSTQFRAVLTKYIRSVAFGVSMRSRGGIYFIDQRRQQAVDALNEVFSAYPRKMLLYKIPMFDEAGTRIALRDAVVGDITAEIEGAVNTLQIAIENAQKAADEEAEAAPGEADAKLSERIVQNKVDEANEILVKIEFYQEALAGQQSVLAAKVAKLKEVVTELGVTVPESFQDMLNGI